MKKLKMGVNLVVVLTIVGSAFAYKTKAGRYCVSANTTTTQCTALMFDWKIALGTPTRNYYPNWDGNVLTCIGSFGRDSCIVPVRFEAN